MKTLVILLLAIPLIIGCEKSHENPGDSDNIDVSGKFLGTFHRTGGETSNVSILFTGNLFEGESDKVKYPAICRGTFSVDQANDRITFDNACVWTADFDWSLILDGEYQFDVNEDQALIIHRTNGAVTDEYKLYRVTK